MPKLTVIPDWKTILRHAWSVRLMILAALLSGLEVALPLVNGLLPIRPGIFALLSGLVVAGAFVARFVVQKRIRTIRPRRSRRAGTTHGPGAAHDTEGYGLMWNGFSQTGDWNRDLQPRPTAMTVARLAGTHGFEACFERWPSLHPRTIWRLARTGKRQLERREASVSHSTA